MDTHAIQNRITAKLKEGIALCEAAFGRSFKMPRVEYTRAAGVAGSALHRAWLIKLSAPLLRDPANVDEMIDVTVPHELAHLITAEMYPETQERGPLQFTRRGVKRGKRDVHGADWKHVMHILGANPERCHNMQLSGDFGQKAQKARYDWVCTGCKETIQLGPKHNRMQELYGGTTVTHGRCPAGSRRHPLVKPGASTAVAAPVPVYRPPVRDIPRILETIIQNAERPVARPAPAAPSFTKPIGGGSKMDMCKVIWSASKHLPRQQVIQLFIHQAGCTPAGAATYYATLKSKG